MAGGTLLALTLQIEEGVVDSDRHPHQQDHRLGRVGGMEDVARERREPHRGKHRREGEQDRYAGGDEGTKGDQQDQEGDRHGELLRLHEVLVDRLTQLMRRAGKTELRDRERGVRLLKVCDSVEQRLHTRVSRVQLSLHVELDQLCTLVLRDLTASSGAQFGHLRHRPQLRQHALYGRAEGRVSDGSRLRANDDAFCRRGVESGACEQLLGTSRFARRLLGRGQCVRADRHAESDRDYNERDPDGDRGLPMTRTPTSCTSGKVVAVHETAPPGSAYEPVRLGRRQIPYSTTDMSCLQGHDL